MHPSTERVDIQILYQVKLVQTSLGLGGENNKKGLHSPVSLVSVCYLLYHVLMAGIQIQCAADVLPLDSLGVVPGMELH